jgi:hypothetical protein
LRDFFKNNKGVTYEILKKEYAIASTLITDLQNFDGNKKGENGKINSGLDGNKLVSGSGGGYVSRRNTGKYARNANHGREKYYSSSKAVNGGRH